MSNNKDIVTRSNADNNRRVSDETLQSGIIASAELSSSNSSQDDKRSLDRQSTSDLAKNLRMVRSFGNGYRPGIDCVGRMQSGDMGSSSGVSREQSSVDETATTKRKGSIITADDFVDADLLATNRRLERNGDISHRNTSCSNNNGVSSDSSDSRPPAILLDTSKNVRRTRSNNDPVRDVNKSQRQKAVAPGSLPTSHRIPGFSRYQRNLNVEEVRSLPTSTVEPPALINGPITASQSEIRLQPQLGPLDGLSDGGRQRQQQRPQPPSTRWRGRLARNGAFCPCFSPNDSDTEPSSPGVEMAVTQSETSAQSNGVVVSLARELRARFATSSVRTVPSNNLIAEPTNVVADPYPVPVHTQVEYTHYLVPDLLKITHASYYWGVMDRFEAERLLENQAEGTFLLRDSAQSEYLFSVSFRRYQRTLHARVEQLNHKFSFDSYDPGVFSADTVTELIEHYKDPAKCLFFEPQLSRALPRNFVFPLQHLCRSAIANCITYNDIQALELPKKLKDNLREYHYKQPVRVTKLE